MSDAVSVTCAVHPNRHDCPDALLKYIPRFDEYGLIIHDGGESVSTIDFCPWCGAQLPDSKRDTWFVELERLGVDPSTDDVPEKFKSDAWWAGA